MASPTGARVFVAEASGRFDMTAADEYGTRVNLTRERQVFPTNLDDALRWMFVGLDDHGYDPDVDYLVHTGPGVIVSVLMVVATLVAKKKGRPAIRMLIFEARSGRYVSRLLDVASIESRADSTSRSLGSTSS